MERHRQPSLENKSSVPGMPVWVAKSQSRRYENDDDIQFSLPSGDDGFFSLHFGENPPDLSPHQSTFDKINEELGFSKISGSGAGSISLEASSNKNSSTCLTAELQQYSLRGEEENVNQDRLRKKNIILHTPYVPKFMVGGDESDAEEERNDALTRLKNSGLLTEKLEESSFLASELNDKLTEIAENKNLGLVSKVQNFLTRTVPATPVPSVTSSPKQVRKISLPVSTFETDRADKSKAPAEGSAVQFNSSGPIDKDSKMSYHSFFFYPDSDKMRAPATNENKTAEAKKELKSGEKLKPEYENAFYKGKKPKPSRMREMNFWAPTSM